MPDAAELIAVARLLVEGGARTPPSEAQLRRAVSTAYYALFHCVLRAAAGRFMGAGHETRGGYAILYRSFDHGHVRRICEELKLPTLKDLVQRRLRRATVGQPVRDFAGSFPTLQDARHLADYDPFAEFPPSDVVTLIDAAEAAIAAFDRIEPDEQADILALMMVRAR